MPWPVAVVGIAGAVAAVGRIILGLWATLRATKWFGWMIFGIFTWMGGLIGRMFQLLGITLVANTYATPVMRDYIATNLMSLPPVWVGFIGLTKVDQAITIILSAVAIRIIDDVRVKRRRESWQTPL